MHPMQVVIVMERCLEVLKKMVKRDPMTAIFIDSTGGIVESIDKEQPKPLYYAIVIHEQTCQKLLPVAEYVTNLNNSKSIRVFLAEFLDG